MEVFCIFSALPVAAFGKNFNTKVLSKLCFFKILYFSLCRALCTWHRNKGLLKRRFRKFGQIFDPTLGLYWLCRKNWTKYRNKDFLGCWFQKFNQIFNPTQIRALISTFLPCKGLCNIAELRNGKRTRSFP